jgi:hypothetical protein
MAITVVETQSEGDRWMVYLAVAEGVYRWDRYPVRLTRVAAPPAGLSEAEQREIVSQWTVQHVRRHMRSGALPPTGMLLTATDIWQAAQGASTSA